MILDLGSTRVLVERALFDVAKLDGTDLDADVGETARRGSTKAAETNRRLQYLVHVLRRAAEEAEAQYFKTRGFPDLLEKEEVTT